MQRKEKKFGLGLRIALTALGVIVGGLTAGSTFVSARHVEGISLTEKKSPNEEAKLDKSKYLFPHEFTEEELEEMHYYDELDLLACAVFAEAGNQGLEGMALACDVILNRVDSPEFPNTIRDVIYQKNQFEIVSNGSIDTVSPTEECFEACKRELNERRNKEIVYFRTQRFADYGTPCFKYKDHYFSRS